MRLTLLSLQNTKKKKKTNHYIELKIIVCIGSWGKLGQKRYKDQKIILVLISHFMVFANDLLLAAYFIFILDYGNDIRQKAILSDFLIWVQNGL